MAKRVREKIGRKTKAKGGQSAAAMALDAPAVRHLQLEERDTLRVRVYRALAHGLMTGMFTPGEAVTLRTLAGRLGTSPMPVREAVSRLIAERALVLLHNRSVIVPRMSRTRFGELTQARQTLEGLVAEIACNRAGSELIAELTTINEQMKACLDKGDVKGALVHNMAFHFSLYRASGNQVVLPLIEMLWLQAGPFMALSVTTPNVRWTAKHHKAILAALRAADGVAARVAVESDINDSGRQLLEQAIFEEHRYAGLVEKAAH